jgi:hypothetical protein
MVESIFKSLKKLGWSKIIKIDRKKYWRVVEKKRSWPNFIEKEKLTGGKN